MNGKSLGTVACTALLKTLLLAFNLIFFAIGLIFLVIGVYGFKVFTDFFSFAPSKFIYIPIMCIGIVMMITGILSLWCTPKGIRWLLNTYAVGIFVLFLAIFAFSIFFTVKRDAFESTIKRGISSSIESYNGEIKENSIDFLQEKLHCCGSESYGDWFNTKWSKPNNKVPESCCITLKNCNHVDLPLQNATDIWPEGCFKKVFVTIEHNYALIGVIGFASSLFILFGFVLACCLTNNLSKNRYENI
jgi:hypothetical protein